jgi:uncharacterized membrane protein
MLYSFLPQFVRFALNRLKKQLWVRPLVMCILSVFGVFVANILDGMGLGQVLPEISTEAVEALLSIMTASMLVIATFAVGAMVSAYASASNVATPRSFSLVVADDVSQNALSVFVAAFIYSTVALVTLKSNYFGIAGRFAIFVMAVIAFTAVIFLFVRWVDRIARLGRLGESVHKVEKATAEAIKRVRDAPPYLGVPREPGQPTGRAVYSPEVGYLQSIDIAGLQTWAEKANTCVTVASLPGSFIAPNRPLAYVDTPPAEQSDIQIEQVARKFTIGNQRMFENDPRFGLIVMSQIASRALSSGINDPGTAIDVIGSLERLLVQWAAVTDTQKSRYDRLEVPQIKMRDMFEDAFTAISRDGAGLVEVSLRVQKALHSLAAVGNEEMRDAAMHQARLALARSEMALNFCRPTWLLCAPPRPPR